MIDSNNQFNKLTRSLIEATRDVMEKKTNKHGHDAVGHEDEDINNDGKTDGTDKYLHNRRKAIASSMKKEEVEAIDELSKKTLASYVKGAANHRAKLGAQMNTLDNARRAVSDAQGELDDPSAANAMTDQIRKKHRKLDDKDYNRKYGTHLALKKLAKEEVEEIDELSKNTVRNYYNKAGEQGRDIMGKMAVGGGDWSKDGSDTATLKKREAGRKMALKRRSGQVKMSEENELDEALDAAARYGQHHVAVKELLKSIDQHVRNHKDDALKHKDYRGKKGVHWGHVGDIAQVHSQLADIHDRLAQQGEYKASMAESIEEAKVDGVAAGSMDNDGHLCATKVFHKEWAEGTPIFSQHAEPDANGDIAWYDVMFEHGIEKGVSIEDLDVLMSETHERHGKRKMKEDINNLARAALASLEEARGRPRKNPLPADQSDEPEPRQHIMQQLQRAKLSMRGGEHVTFKDGTKHHVAGHHAEKILAKYLAMKPAGKEEFQKKISASHAAFKEEL